jgi:lipopolysaccharide export system protein LptA
MKPVRLALVSLALCALALACFGAALRARAADDAVEVKPQNPPPAAPAPAPDKGHAPPAGQQAQGEANIAEGGGKAAPPAGVPAPGAKVPAPQPPGQSGTASAPGPHPPTPAPQGAGNTADSNHAGPGRSGPGNVAEGGVEKPGPGGVTSDHSLFSEQDLDQLLPGFAKTPPSSSEPTNPQELLEHPGAGQPYESPLGPTTLPPGSVQQRIDQANSNPGKELETNFGRIVVPTGSIVGSTKTKQFHIEGGLTIFYSNVTISGDTADIDEKQEIAVLSGNVNVIDPRYTMTCDEIRIRFEDKEFQATGVVQFKKLADPNKSQPNLSLPKKQRLREYLAGQQFELYCMNLYYNWDTKLLHAVDSVRLVHPSFSGTMDRVDYDDKTKQYLIDGNVKLEVDKYDWVFENQLVDPQDVNRTRAVTDKPTTIACDRLVYSEDSGLAQFYSKPGGQVVFDQTDRTVKGAYMEVNDQTKDFHVEGTVSAPMTFSQTSGQWLFAGGLINRDEASPELQETLAKPLSATAQTLTYNFDRRRLEMSGGVKLMSEKKSLQADQIVQDDAAKYFLLRGNVMIQPDDSSQITAAQVFLDTANDVVTFVGLVQGKLQNADLGQEAAAAPAPGEAGQPTGQPGSGQQALNNGLFAQGAPGLNGEPGRTAQQADPQYHAQPGTDSTANIAEHR